MYPTLATRPLIIHQCLHLADTHRRVYVVIQTHLQRGKFEWHSEKAAAAASPTWERSQRACEFKVEALEASGTLRWGKLSHAKARKASDVHE